jgi:hypothetical protein
MKVVNQGKVPAIGSVDFLQESSLIDKDTLDERISAK